MVCVQVSAPVSNTPLFTTITYELLLEAVEEIPQLSGANTTPPPRVHARTTRVTPHAHLPGGPIGRMRRPEISGRAVRSARLHTASIASFLNGRARQTRCGDHMGFRSPSRRRRRRKRRPSRRRTRRQRGRRRRRRRSWRSLRVWPPPHPIPSHPMLQPTPFHPTRCADRPRSCLHLRAVACTCVGTEAGVRAHACCGGVTASAGGYALGRG